MIAVKYNLLTRVWGKKEKKKHAGKGTGLRIAMIIIEHPVFIIEMWKAMS